MIRRVAAVVVSAAFCVAAQVQSQSLIKTSKLELRLQNRLYAGAMYRPGESSSRDGVSQYSLQNYFHDTAASPSPNASLTAVANQLCGFRTYELSRLGCALKGAETGATLGLFVGALGNTTNMWNERSSWFLVGAATALGAILGGTAGADDPGWRIYITPEDP